jgi:exosortase
VSEGTVDEPPDLAGMIRAPLLWMSLLVLGLSAYLYYPIFFPAPLQTLSARGEEFFFQANQALGPPVLVLSLWLFYRRSHLRDLLNGPGSTMPAAGILIGAAAIFGWGAYTTAADIQLMSVIGLLGGIVLLFGGPAGLRAYWLPILYLGFALPIPPVLLAAVIYPLQLATAEYVGLILNGIGFASLVQGDQILRPENTFIVIETCSGIRTVVTLSMLTILMIDLFERRGWHVVILICLAPIVAFLTNALRVVTLVLNPHSNIHSIHNVQGLVMLLVGLTTIALLDQLIGQVLGSRDPNAADGSYGTIRVSDASSRRRMMSLVAVSMLLVGMLSMDRLLPRWSLSRSQMESPAELLARTFGEDPSAPYPIDYKFIGSVHYLDQARHRVEIDGGIVEVHLGIANEQLRGYSILTRRLAWPETGYAAVVERFEEIAPGGPVARRMVLRRGARRVVSYSWIEGSGSLPVEWFRKAAALDRSAFVRANHMLAIRLTTDFGPGVPAVDAAEGRIRRVWERLEPELIGYAAIRKRF